MHGSEALLGKYQDLTFFAVQARWLPGKSQI